MLEPLNKALSQIDDPAFLRVVWHSVALSTLVFILLGTGVWYATLHAGIEMPHWIASLLGGLAAVLLALFAFVPLAGAIASSFTDPIAAAVEHRHYPWLAQPKPARLSVQLYDGLALGIRVALLQIVAFVLAIVLPGPGLALGWLITAWAIGRGLFVSVAMRRMDRRAALAAYAQRRWAVIGQGAVIALCMTIPFVNLIAPVFGIAALTHVLHEGRALSLRPPV